MYSSVNVCGRFVLEYSMDDVFMLQMRSDLVLCCLPLLSLLTTVSAQCKYYLLPLVTQGFKPCSEINSIKEKV